MNTLISVDAGLDHTCALTKGGKVKCWGLDSFGELGDFGNETKYKPIEVSKLGKKAKAVRVSAFSSHIIDSDGGVRAKGITP